MAYIGPRNSAPIIRDSLHIPAYQVKLENVYGLTVTSNAALDCNPSTELIAYPAGCTVVLYNPRKNRQTHILNASRKSITCVAFSRCGRYLATGECGLSPCVRVWDMQDPTSISAVQVAEFSGHKHGVGFLVFSTSSKYLVSVGSQHDMIVNVWDWKSNLKFASNKVSSRVKAVSFSENGNYFVTVGFRHVKFWYLDYSRNAKYKEPVPLMGRSAILGEQKDNEFCDVVCGRDSSADSTFALTRSGLLCEFNSKRLLEKWVGLRTASANCMAIGSNYIFVGCAEGIVRCFSPKTLEYITTLPQSHYLGVDVSQGYNISHIRYSKPEDARYPDAIALTYDDTNFKLTCVYNDHSLFVWDVRDIKRVGKSHSALYHSACIWGLDMVSTEEPLPPGCFLTCSSDDTIRFWQTNPSTTNIYSTELTKILYIDPELKFIKDADLTSTNDKEKSKSYDDKTGVRCVRVSHDGEHIASGDRAGNIRIYATATHFIVRTLEAHDAEVLCLEYSDNPKLLASASRDRLIHVFQVDKNYELLQTLDDHSSSITAVRFIRTSTGLQMVSCGADKSILFRQMVTENGTYQFTRYMNVSGRCTLYDMEVDIGGRHIMTACQDRNVRVYSTAQGKHTKTFRGTIAEDGTLIKVALDSSGIYLATSSTDKILSIYDYYSGECMATMCGHSEIVTGLRFTPDCQHLISASGDGCIFVWRVPHDMVVTMRARLAQQRKRKGNAVDGISGSESDSLPQDTSDKFVTPIVPDYTLNIGRLPSWAIKSLGNVVPPNNMPAPEPPSRGKWAARINLSEISVKRTDSDGSKESSLDSGTDTQYVDKKREHTSKQRPKSLNFSLLPKLEALFRNFDTTIEKTYDILMISPRVEKVALDVENKKVARIQHHTDDSSLGSFKYEDHESTEHDGDVEDISDGERTSSFARGYRKTYYPGNNDDDTASKFMVTSMDVDDLRQSLQRSKRRKNDPPKIEVTDHDVSHSGSPQDSDEDEDISTPSCDNGDPNPLSGSCESLDIDKQREKCLKSVFDSLSGAEVEDPTVAGTTSLSSQHLSRTPSRFASAPLPAPRFTAIDPESARKREELNRRIRETKRQLESVGVNSNLKSSQSTHDLTFIGRNEARGRPRSQHVNKSSGIYMRPEETLDSLNYYDSLNAHQNVVSDYRIKNPYAIPANNHKYIPDYEPKSYAPPYMPPQVPQRSNFVATRVEKKTNLSFMQYAPSTTSIAFEKEPPKAVSSKVFSRLFPNTQPSDTNVTDPPKPPSRNFHLSLNKNVDTKPQPKMPKPSARSIFKNYKSCPVSPVSEECKWADKVARNSTKFEANSSDPKKRNSVGYYAPIDTVLPDKGKSIMDTIKSDTERMIAEITEKYGDLDEYEPKEINTTGDYLEKDDGNFSSDSLEDCSLSQDASCKNKLYSKKICRKHNKNRGLPPRRAVSNYEIYGDSSCKPALPAKPHYIASSKSSTLPKNMPSSLDEAMDESNTMGYYTNMYRCQSVLTKRCITTSNESVLSDNSNCSSVSNEIFLRYGNEGSFQQAKFSDSVNVNKKYTFDNIEEPDDQYIERHSSASFFLNQKKYMKSSCSQESVLSDEMFLDEHQLSRTNCNSLESVLSDESECTKSAPLEMLFEDVRAKRQQQRRSTGITRSTKSCYEFDNQSKSYGSSPNNPSMLVTYMYNNYMGEPSTSNYRDAELTTTAAKPPISKVYGFDIPDNEPAHKSVTRSRSLHDSSNKQAQPLTRNIAYYFDGNKVQQYAKDAKQGDEKDIQNKSAKNEMEEKQQTAMVKSKSCSFEVVLEPATKPIPIKHSDKRSSHVQRNLEKFEEQIRRNTQAKMNKSQLNKENSSNNKHNNATKSLERGAGGKNYTNKVIMEFVPHKPPKPIKRTSSVKLNVRLKDKSGMSTAISSQYKAKLDGLQRHYSGRKKQDNNSNKIDTSQHNERTFEIFVKEKDVNENKSEMQMDSLEMDRMKQMSMDSLDVLEDNNDFTKDSLDYYAEQDNKKHMEKYKKQREVNNLNDSLRAKNNNKIEPKIKNEEFEKYKCIERKIEIINKLVEMEERKMLQEKLLKEWRMRPLRANINDGNGVVKVLSRKFETLAKKQTPGSNFANLTLEESVARAVNLDTKEIKRNLSLPDILNNDEIGELITIDKEVECENPSVDDKSNKEMLNNAVTLGQTVPPQRLKQTVYNETVIPKTDIHIDSENYESSTTSSSCANSPKRLSILERNRQCMMRKLIRLPTPRSGMENALSGVRANCLMADTLNKRMPSLTPVLASAPTTVNCNSSKYNNMESRGDGEMRRAISLSDLAVKPTPAPRRPVTSKPGTNKSSTFRRPLSTTNLDVIHNSASVINDPVRVSDSEDDHHIPRRGYNIGGRNQSLMRPTISSMNKAAATVVRRRGIVSAASSTVNLSSGVHEGSSSEAEEHNIRANTALNKPAVPARPRNVKMGRSGSSRDLSTKVHDVTAKQKLNNSDCQDQESEISLEITTSNSTILCHELAEQLTKVAAKIVRLYRKLQDPDATLTKDDNSSLLSGLELAMRETQKVLEDTVPKQDGNNANDGNDTLSSLSSDDGDFSKNVLSADNARLKLEQLVNKEGACSTDETMTSIEQYSDILLNIMQNKIVNQYPESSQSLPPNTNDNARQS